MPRIRYHASLLALVALVFTSVGCDAIAEKLGVDKVNVPLTSVGSLGVNGETPALKTATVSRDGGNLPNVFDVKSIAITPADVSWTTTSKSSAASGTVHLLLLLKRSGNWIPFVNGTATITNDQVTAVSPSLYALSQAARDAVGRIPAAQRPSLDYANGKSVSQLSDEIEAALRAQGIEVNLIVWGSPGLKGNVTFNKIQVNLDF